MTYTLRKKFLQNQVILDHVWQRATPRKCKSHVASGLLWFEGDLDEIDRIVTVQHLSRLTMLTFLKIRATFTWTAPDYRQVSINQANGTLLVI